SALAGAGTIIALDIDEKKLDWAKDLGATDVVNTKGMSEDEVVSAIQERTGGFGADVVVDAVGRPETWGRPSTVVTSPAPSCWWACPPRRWSSPFRWPMCSVAAAGSSPPGTATACPSAISRCSSSSMNRAGCPWTSSYPN